MEERVRRDTEKHTGHNCEILTCEETELPFIGTEECRDFVFLSASGHISTKTNVSLSR